MDSIYESLTELEKTGLTLRDFFNSHDSRSLKSAYVRLNPTAAVNLTDRAWLEAEYDFNALFVDPGKLLAAPFASVYLEDDALVMGKATLEIREFMAALGLSVNQESNIPDDHISCVLELTTLLLANTRQTSPYRSTLTQYINNYLTKWVPLYIEKIKTHAQTATLYTVADILFYWLDELKREYQYE
ncbi:molecular chaperone [Salmonella enterica subsp. enterica]|nr:molecular chaperone [Salmonella enterica]EIY9159374.1 molecular chaperone [Salmonella enterica subsp. enterica]EKG1942084.1 molecular chaperone [Salmonella enterica]EKZ2359999.1 molecular chaperone [Salmonella enterica]ELE9125139.1 molecular chaperone [Salmonella enterica]